MRDPQPLRVLAVNRRVRYDYDILERTEAGIELLGHEVKSAKAGHCSLRGSFVHLRGGEAWLTNATIAPYPKTSGLNAYDQTRPRRILLRRRDLNRLRGKHDAERLTIVPLDLHVTRGLVKVTIALVRGRRKYEKREAIKQREVERQLRGALGTFQK